MTKRVIIASSIFAGLALAGCGGKTAVTTHTKPAQVISTTTAAPTSLPVPTSTTLAPVPTTTLVAPTTTTTAPHTMTTVAHPVYVPAPAPAPVAVPSGPTTSIVTGTLYCPQVSSCPTVTNVVGGPTTIYQP